MVDLEARVEILEALLSRLLRERHLDIPPPSDPSPLRRGEQIAASTSTDAVQIAPSPHPDWLPVQHQKCGGPGVYLTNRVSGVHVANYESVRILPRSMDPEGGYWITEPYRIPMSSDVVLCATCVQPIDLWSNRDLDYRPWLDNELGQPLYPKQTGSVVRQMLDEQEREAKARHEQDVAWKTLQDRTYAERQEDQLLRLKQQAQTLREQASNGARILPPL